MLLSGWIFVRVPPQNCGTVSTGTTSTPSSLTKMRWTRTYLPSSPASVSDGEGILSTDGPPGLLSAAWRLHLHRCPVSNPSNCTILGIMPTYSHE